MTAQTQPAAPAQPTIGTVVDNEMCDLIVNYLWNKDKGHEYYERADAIHAQIIGALPVGPVVTLPDGRRFEVRDNFADKNVAFRPVGVKKLELTEVKEPKSGKKSRDE